MAQFTEEELLKAYKIWLRKYPAREEEQILNNILREAPMTLNLTPVPWLRTLRKIQYLSAKQVAARLQVSRSAYSRYEEDEVKGVLTLNTLARAAEALDCELIYVIRPKSRSPFSKKIWDQLVVRAQRHNWLNKCYPKRRVEALAAIASRLMCDPHFRKERGWSMRLAPLRTRSQTSRHIDWHRRPWSIRHLRRTREVWH